MVIRADPRRFAINPNWQSLKSQKTWFADPKFDCISNLIRCDKRSVNIFYYFESVFLWNNLNRWNCREGSPKILLIKSHISLLFLVIILHGFICCCWNINNKLLTGFIKWNNLCFKILNTFHTTSFTVFVLYQEYRE